MIRFSNILLGSPLPLHPYLADHQSLSIRLIVDGSVCGETTPVNGDVTSGMWEINSSLRANTIKSHVTLAVVATLTIQGASKCLKFQFASVTLSLEDLLKRARAQLDGAHEFNINDSCSSMQLLMTCLVEVFPPSVVSNPASRVPASGNDPTMRGAEIFFPQGANDSNRLSTTLIDRFRRSGALADIDRAILHCQGALTITQDLDADMPARLSDLGIALQLRFELRGGLADLESSLLCQRQAVDIAPYGHPDKANLFANLGRILQFRFVRLGNLRDLEDSITNQEKAIELTRDGDPDKPARLSNLGTALRSRFGRLGSYSDLEGAILNHEKAVNLTPDEDPGKPLWLNNLGNALQFRFVGLGRLTDLEYAIRTKRRAVELMPDNDLNKPGLCCNLAVALQSRFNNLGIIEDLEESICTMQKVVELTEDGHPSKQQYLANLGNALRSRFDRLGGIGDMEDAILNHQKAVELTPDDHLDKPKLLSDLGSALQLRFVHLSSITDLEDAISSRRRAIELTEDSQPDKPTYLGNLGDALQLRFELLGSLADLEEAILNERKAAELMPNGHIGKPIQLNRLGNALQLRFERFGNIKDLEDAIWNKRKAVELTADGQTDKPGLVNNLGNVLYHRFVHLGNATDLEDSISNFRMAIELTPDGRPDKANMFNSLGNAIQSRFQRTADLADLEDAISNKQRAVELTPDGHSHKTGRVSNLGKAFLNRFFRLGHSSDLESGLLAFSTAANSTTGPAMLRFKAARTWAKAAELHSRSPLDAFRCAIDLLPRIAWLGLAVTDQHALLADVGDVVRDAVAAAIRYEEYETAVVWAEQGRSIVWQNLLGLRSPIEDLREARPELSGRLLLIAQQLERSGSDDGALVEMPTASTKKVTNHSKLAIEWEKLTDEIRRIPGFEGFLKAKTFIQLASAAHDGPVVILNVNESRCDALVLIADDSAEARATAVNFPLKRFSYDKSRKMFQALKTLLSSAGLRERNDRKTGKVESQVDGDTKFKTILRALWQDVVKPVIEGLAFQTQSERPPRMWWCATGFLAFLPIHAAGIYDTHEAGERISDYVVSSYVPTLTAILDLSEPVEQDGFQVLTVAQASAPGAPPIPKTEDEVQIVHSLAMGIRVLNLTRENATVKNVREGMMESHWIHLACHGQQNPSDPMKSGFLLHDKVFELSQIVNLALPKAEFAFLSACQTAMGDEKVAEESVHLAAGMLLSGCRGVIATTWSIRDDDGPKVAQEVYSRMFGGGKPNRKEAAYALHEAVKLLRDSGAQCMSWVPFIHIGR